MKALPYKITSNGYAECSISEATHVRLRMPSPIENRILPIYIGNKSQSPSWKWNGSTDIPTFEPSILSKDGVNVCHSYVRDGFVEFLSDCTHEYAGQKLPLLEVD